MKKIFVLLMLLIPAPLLASDDYYHAEYVRNYDADTITFNLPWFPALIGESVSVRLSGVDAPEIRGKCDAEIALAKKAKGAVSGLLEMARDINLFNMRRGQYFRIVADVEIDGLDLKTFLLKNRLAVAYDGGKKTKDWCDELRP